MKKEYTKHVEKVCKKGNKGITLIALVITIIVLLILAGITISSITGDNGLLKRAQEAIEETNQSQYDEQYALQSILDEFNYASPSEESYNGDKEVNSPKVTKGMIPIKWNGNNWEVCSENDEEWYNYINGDKLWANVMLSDGKYKSGEVEEGTIVKEKDLGSMYVWIPRYAYKMPEDASKGQKGTIAVTFLKGNTNTDKDGKTYQKATAEVNTEATAIVHPAFTIGSKELTGIWVAKFEMSGKNGDEKAVGNATKEGDNGEYNPTKPDNTTIAKSLPNVPSWRNISVGESEYQSMAIAGQNKEKFGIDYCSSHLIRNSEWGAIAYLCYSDYGNAPKINACGSNNGSWWYDVYTGQGPKLETGEGPYGFDATTIENHGYSTENGMLASTTGNITGIYDMNGGAYEVVAAYLDNVNENLDAGGKSTSHNEVKYFEGGKLKSEYSSLWECYEVSQEEKNNQINVDGGSEVLTQKELWDKNGVNFKDAETNKKYNVARKRLTDTTFDLLAKVKGIGVNEVVTNHSYYGVTTNGSYKWLMDTEDAKEQFAKTWDDDGILIGHTFRTFINRGGSCGDWSLSGVLYLSFLSSPDIHCLRGFRSVLVV